MKRALTLAILFLYTCILFGQTSKRDSSFNFDWKFYKGNIDNAELPEFNDAGWKMLDLPHDWSIEDLSIIDSSVSRVISGPFDSKAIGGTHSGFTVGGTGWYRKHFKLSSFDSTKVVYIDFDGISMNSEFWINGHHIGSHPYGFSPFWFDISDYLNYGEKENVIAIQVKNEGVNCRWYSGSGIYRNVTLSIVEKIHIAPWEVFVSTPEVDKSKSKVRVQANLNNYLNQNKDIVFKVQIKDPDNKLIAAKEILTRLHYNIPSEIKMNLSIDSPEFWSPDFPNLYKLQCSILVNNVVLDTYKTKFGIRRIEFDAEEGMFLNGEPIKLKGGAMHANNGPLGAAAFQNAEERRVRIMKEAGYNAVRCAHNPPSKVFLEECDKQGLLVIDEAFDTWVTPKLPDDYHYYFDDYWKKDLENMILRDINHPSIFTWSIGNQIRTAHDSIGISLAHELADYIRKLDNTRPVTANVFMWLQVRKNFMDGSPEIWKEYDAFFEALDICGYSYQSAQYQNVHKRLPDRVQFSSEINPKYCFRNWMRAIDNKYVIGNFTWTAMDYMGEASSGWLRFNQTPSAFPWHSTYCGDIDLCGFRKPRSYYRDILFNNGKQLHLFVHAPVPSFEGKNESLWGWDDVKASWSWQGFEGDSLKVDVYTAYEQVELFLNDFSLGKKAVSRNTEYKANWLVPYSRGALMVVGYQDGKIVDSCKLETTGTPFKINLIPEKTVIRANRQDLCFIQVEITDKDGRVVPYADNLISFKVKGNGTIAGVGNSNPTSIESFQKPFRKAYEGKCILIVKSSDRKGKISIIAESHKLKPDKIEIKTTKLAVVNRR